jgi:23S rRNA pseudouridine1911/1915/1917 synthase
MQKLEVLYEDNHIIIVNKPSGALAQGDKTGDKTLGDDVKIYIKYKYNKPGDVFLGVVHRLDRPVSGALIFARTSKALARLNEQFKNKEVEKTYWAVVKNLPEEHEGTLVHYLKKNEKNNTSKAHISANKGGLLSELSYKLIGSIDNYHLLEVKPKTGRHHQIRAQLAAMGCPIKGDVKYGFQRPNDDKSIHLHARRVKFMHPVKKEWVEVTAPTPKDVVWRSFTAVEKEDSVSHPKQ